MASSSSHSTFRIKFHRGGVFVRDPFSYDYDMLTEIADVNVSELGYVGLVKLLVSQSSSDIQQFFYVVPGLDLESGLRALKNEGDLKKCVELGEKHDHVLDIYVSHSVFELHDATSPSALPHIENAQSNDDNDDTDSDLEGDYNIFEYDTEEESDTASIDHLSDGEDELFEVRTKRPDPAPKAKSKKMFDENFLTRVYNGLPRDGYAEDDVGPKYNSVSHEDDDKIGDHWPVHNPDIKWKLMKPHLGEKFESIEQLKRMLTYYALAGGYKLYYKVNNPKRLLAKCCRDAKDRKCPFRLWASWMTNERTFQIKTLNEEHACSRTYEYGSLVTSNWIAFNYAKKIMINPCIKVRELIDLILKKFKCKVTISQARRGKIKALDQYETCLQDHYGMLWSYARGILDSNPGSTCLMSVDAMPDGKNYFSRFYVCFKGLKEAWLEGCRRVIGIDGCFLKTICKGELLSAVGRDGNNQIFPIAWAVVSVENKDNWTWFLSCLMNDLGMVAGEGLTIISDQHKVQFLYYLVVNSVYLPICL